MFAPSLYNGIIGEFATQAERDYLFDDREFWPYGFKNVTSAYISGFVGELPAGDIGFVTGVERNKTIFESPDTVADQGLLFGFSADGGARGTDVMEEGFMELGLPLLAGVRFVKSLQVSARHAQVTSTNKLWVEQVAHGRNFCC